MSQAEEPNHDRGRRQVHGLGGGWRRRAGSGGTDGRKIAFYRRHEAALAPQSEQVWVENLSLTTERQRGSSAQFSAAVSVAQ
jgi:hypothetical protein